MRTILFVCSGNTCRSPLAVAAWRAFCAPRMAEYRAAPAGLLADAGAPVSRGTRQLAQDWGVDLNAHRSRRLTTKIARRAYLICPMTPQQAERIVNTIQVEPARVRLLAEFALEGGDSIVDPIGGSFEAYETCGARIRDGVEGLCRALSAGRITLDDRTAL